MKRQGSGMAVVRRQRTWMAMLLVMSMLFGSISPSGTITSFAADPGDGTVVTGQQETDATGGASTQPETTSNDPALTDDSQDAGSGTSAGTTDGSGNGTSAGTTDGSGNGTPAGTTDETGSGATGGNTSDTNNGEAGNTGSSEDGTLPEAGEAMGETTGDEAVTEEVNEGEEDTGEGEDLGEEEIIVEEEVEWESMEAMMAGAGGTLGKIEDLDVQGKYDPTDAFGGVLPYPRGTKTNPEDVMSKGIPDTKDKTVGATKVLSGDLSDITQWDHIWFGKTNRNPSVASSYYYDYAEKNYWLEHFRWRVLDPTQDNTALEVNGNNIEYKKNQPDAGKAIFLMSEGFFAKKPDNTEYESFEYSNLDTDFETNKDSIADYADEDSIARKWLKGFPGRNFTTAEANAVRKISKKETGSITNNYAPHNPNNDTTYGKGVEDYIFIRKYKADGITPESYARIVKVPRFQERGQRKMQAQGLTGEKVFFLSAGEVLAKEYGFDSKGKDINGDDYTSGYCARWTGRGDWQFDFGFSYLNYDGLDGTAIRPNGNTKTDIKAGDAWDSRVLEWKGYRYRKDGLSVPYTYSGSISWRLRSYGINGSNSGIVQGLSTTWYTGQGGGIGSESQRYGHGLPSRYEPGA